jgi:acyl-CoA thioester hydrolase
MWETASRWKARGETMSKGWIESFKGVVYPWHCDHLGHMNVQHYVGMFDQAAYHYQAELGFELHEIMADQGEIPVDVRHTIQYVQEQRVGSLVIVESCLTRIGTKSLTFLHRMKNRSTGAIAATSEIVAVYFDLATRKSLVIPKDLRTQLAAYVVDDPGAP